MAEAQRLRSTILKWPAESAAALGHSIGIRLMTIRNALGYI